MKKHLLIPLFLLLASVPLRAQQPEMLVQYLDLSSQKRLTFLVHGEYTTVNIYQDTVDFVAIRCPLAVDTAYMSESFSLSETQDHFHSTLWIGGIGRQGIFEVHTKRKDIDICVQYYNSVRLCTVDPRDTLRLNTLHVQTNDFSTMAIARMMLVAQDVFLLAEDCSRITYNGYMAEHYSENTKDNGVIYGGTRNGESQASKHHLLEYDTEGYDAFRWHYHAADRLHFSFIGSLLTLGERPLSGFGWRWGSPWNPHPDDYGPFQFQHTRTTPTSFQAECSYDVIAKPRFAAGVGAGYCYSRFLFASAYVGAAEYDQFANPADPNVVYSHNSCNLAHLQTHFGNERDWTTWFTTHYLTIPITFTYYAADNHRKGFHAGIDLIPGFAVGRGVTHRQLCSWGVVADEPVGMVVNEYEYVDLEHTLDVRLSIGWGAWSVILQVCNSGSFDVWKSPSRMAYPFRMGLKISL